MIHNEHILDQTSDVNEINGDTRLDIHVYVVYAVAARLGGLAPTHPCTAAYFCVTSASVTK